MNIKKHIPNSITCLNLLSGSLAIVVALVEQDLTLASWLVALAALFDFFDGLVARALGVSSPIGKDLDSLADVVSFGVAPAMIMMQGLWGIGVDKYLAMPVLLLGAFAALRLAKFNNDTRQSTSFIGLPVPANALFWLGLQSVLPQSRELLLDSEWMLLGGVYVCTFLLSYLMVSEIPMFSFKIKERSFSALRPQMILLAGSAIAIAFLGFAGLSASVLLYVALSAVMAQPKA